MSDKKINKVNIKINIKRVTSLLIAILPILDIYRLGTSSFLLISFGEVTLVLIVVLSLIDGMKRGLRFQNHGFLPFFAVCFVISLLSVVIRGQRNIEDFIIEWFRIAACYYVIEIVYNGRNESDVIFMQRVNVVAGVAVSILLFFQVIAEKIFGRVITFFIDAFPLNYSMTMSETLTFYDMIRGLGGWRPTSVFCEPAHFSQFVLMSLVIALFCSEKVLTKTQKNTISILITAAILMSNSANGIFIAAILWVIWFFKYMRNKITVRKMIVVIFLTIVGIYVFVALGFMDIAFERLSSVSSGKNYSTGYLRLLQGLEAFRYIPAMGKVFGIGFGNIDAYFAENYIVMSNINYDMGNVYMNGFSTILLSSGIVGLIVYLIMWFRMFFTHKGIVSRVALLIVTILFCTSAFFGTCSSVMYLVFVTRSDRVTACEKPYMDKNKYKIKKRFCKL